MVISWWFELITTTECLLLWSHQGELSFDFQHFQSKVLSLRFPFDYEIPPNIHYFDDLDRPRAEIAAFVIDNALGFRRAVPVAGRSMNIMEDFFPFACEDLMDSTHESLDKNICFYGKCKKCFEEVRMYCGNPDVFVASIAAYIPVADEVNITVSCWTVCGKNYLNCQILVDHKTSLASIVLRTGSKWVGKQSTLLR